MRKILNFGLLLFVRRKKNFVSHLFELTYKNSQT